ncbi:hypothetical protein BG003_006206 [Podila horticola]|nr:hypothetical protein BG003_006206 [Podila horticola]
MRLLRRPGVYWLTPGRLTPQQQLDAVTDPGNWPSEQQVREQAYREYRKVYPLSRLPFVGPSRSHFERMNADSPVFTRTRLRMRRAAGLLPVDGILQCSDEHGISWESQGALTRYYDPGTLTVEDSFPRYHDQRILPGGGSFSRDQGQGEIVPAEGSIPRYEEDPSVEPCESAPPCNGASRLARRKNKPGFFKRIWSRLSRKVDIQEAPASGPDGGITPHRRG